MKKTIILLITFLFSIPAISLTHQEYFHDIKLKSEQGDANAQLELYFAYQLGRGVRQNENEGIKWLEKSAENGNVKSQGLIGTYYLYGTGVKQDFTKAIKWLTAASKQGDDGSLFVLAGMYKEGNGVKKDMSRAKEYYGIACDNGNQIGCDAYAKLNQKGY
ncbi:sel1 repeat family protein [Morganella morganii]|uniref:tetratricopeptide repeat protein n=1 Tax=Morganella morganii TaxID=582 RepID=UPI00339BEB24